MQDKTAAELSQMSKALGAQIRDLQAQQAEVDAAFSVKSAQESASKKKAEFLAKLSPAEREALENA